MKTNENNSEASWGIEWKTLAFHGTRVGSVGKELLLKERKPLGRGAFGSLLVKGNKEVRIFCQTKENLKNQEISLQKVPSIEESTLSSTNRRGCS